MSDERTIPEGSLRPLSTQNILRKRISKVELSKRAATPSGWMSKSLMKYDERKIDERN